MKEEFPEEYELTKRILKATFKGNPILPPKEKEIDYTNTDLLKVITILEDLHNAGLLEKKFYYQVTENKLYTISPTGEKVYEKLCYT